MQQKQNKNTTKKFQFKQFVIHGGQAGMPVSTDGILLGAWANVTEGGRLLDIGTGTGLLALMCAQRFPQLDITAIDIDKFAIETAKTNVRQSPWFDRIRIKQDNAETYVSQTPFTDIICNPPYFNAGETAKINQRAIARHTTTLRHNTLISQCHKLTTSTGQAHFILPINEGLLFIQIAEDTQWHLSRYWEVQPTPDKPVHRLLLSFTKQPVITEKQTLTIRGKNGYSDAFIQLTHAFYLKM